MSKKIPFLEMFAALRQWTEFVNAMSGWKIVEAAIDRATRSAVVAVEGANADGQALAQELDLRFLDCAAALEAILESVLYEFPVRELDFAMPRWVTMLDSGHWLQSSVYQAALDFAARITRMKDLQAAGAQALDCEAVARSPVTGMDLAEGSVRVTVELKPEVFYQVLSEQTGLEIGDEAGLMPCIIELARAKREYERLQGALEQGEATGYGIVMPSVDQMHLEQPQIVRQGGRYGVRLEASAPSIHIIWNKKKFRTEKSTERKSIQSGVDGIHLNISTTKAAAPFGELPLLLWVGVYINQDEHMVS